MGRVVAQDETQEKEVDCKQGGHCICGPLVRLQQREGLERDGECTERGDRM